MTTRLAQQLTGSHQAGEILAELSRRNYFTVKRSLPEPVYQYHPLFREFLLAQAKQQLTDAQLIQTQHRAAEILEGAGQFEEAIVLYSQTEDWERLAGLILQHARTMVEQGRSQILSEWIVSIPEPLRNKMPWLFYWLGVCRLPFNPNEARGLFEQAFSLFKADDDPVGTLLSWSELVLCIFHESANFGDAARYFKVFDSLPEKLRAPLSLELEARIAVCMIIEANYLPQMRPDTTAWADRMFALLQTDINVNLRLQAAVDLFIYYMWRGLFTKAAMVMQLLNNAVKATEATPLEQIMVKVTDAIYCWLITDKAQVSLEIVHDGLALGEKTGVHIWDFHLLEHGLAAALTMGDLPKAEELLGGLTQLLPHARPLDKAYYYYLAAWYAFQRGDIQKAHTQLSLIKEMKDVLIMPFTKALFFLTSAQVYHRLGDSTQALQDVHAALNEAREMNSRMLEFMARMTAAQIALNLGNEADAVQSLRLGMAVGREEGLINTFGWLPSVMSHLCAKALECSIETDYVQMLIKKRRLLPPEGFVCERWPYPIKIYTLGRFGLLIDDKPIQSSKKAQKKPLEMLKAIISLGGREVKEEEITDLLWPDAEGDAGHKTFEITLIRLRRLIGNAQAIRLQEGLVTLDSKYCFIDVWKFERLISEADALWNENKQTEAVQLSEKAINIYKGNYLKEDRQPYTLSLRERLKGRFVRSLIRTGRYWEGAGDIKKAAELYQKGIEVDNLCEEIYQQLMLCYQRLGLRAEAMAAYNRCRNAMTAFLNSEPSAKTKEIYQRIVDCGLPISDLKN
jgi:DNA-binding SARP family transcriptional activator